MYESQFTTKSYWSLKAHFWALTSWELDHKEDWALKNFFQIVVLEKTLESSLVSKEIKPVNPKGNQYWIFTERTDSEAEASILWPPDAKSRLTGKDPDAGKDWGQGEKGITENEMVGCHHRLSGHEFEQTLGGCEGQGSLQFMGSQRVGHDWATEQQQQDSLIPRLRLWKPLCPAVSQHRCPSLTVCELLPD